MKKKSLRKILQNVKRKNRGITLIALVLTIVILVILATITINFAFGENGLVSMTEDARDITTEATEKEEIEMAVADSKIKDITTPDREKENLEESLRSQFGNDANFTVTENGDESFLINMNDSQRSYYVESTGEIIAQSEMIEIGTAEELKEFRDEVNSGNTFEGKYIRLTNNITLDINEEWEPIGLYPNESSTPDNENNKPFSGTFDGCGYEIDGIYINTTDKVQGLFGLVIGGKILNLTIGENCSITGGLSTGGVAGYLYNSSIINSHNNSNITSNKGKVGGIAGQAFESQILNCSNTATINGDVYHVGGIVGELYNNSKVSTSFNIGEINGTGDATGGIIGQIRDNSTLEKCYNYGNITGNEWTGGVIGLCLNDAYIEECYNVGSISGSGNNVGGIIGKIDTSTLIDSYNVGTILSGLDYIGGITGHIDYGVIQNCYNIGLINTTNASYIGGVVGRVANTSQFTNCFYLQGVVNKENNIEGVTKCTENELKNITSILGSKWEEDTEGINDGYPILSWQ